MTKHIYLYLLLLAFVIVGSLYAALTPDWQAPDEPAHYNYIRQLAAGNLPVLEPGDYDQEYQSLVISSQFNKQYSVESFEYQDYQPPLYYLIQTPIYLLFNDALLPLRLVSLLIGLGVITLTYFIVLILFPDRLWLALMAAAFVAFIPQHTAMLAAVNNDSLAELLIAAILLVTISLLLSGRETSWERQRRRLIILGILLGLGFLTKVSVYIMAPLTTVFLLWLFWGRWRALRRSALLVFGPAIALGLLWWGRNAIVYGDWDLLGTAAHNRIVIGQPQTREWIAELGLFNTLRAFVQTTFQSFWGQFGWMGVVMPAWVYQALLLFTLMTIGGLLWAAANYWTGSEKNGEIEGNGNTSWKAPALLLLGTFLLSLLVYLTYNLTFVQHQGRYLFSALVPISIGFALGWAAIGRPFVKRWPSFAILLPLGLALALVMLDLLALFRFIIPSLT
ncbi:MAG: glycosyltransferase family 39 protein [Candidatus Promineifilaceae bacterium]